MKYIAFVVSFLFFPFLAMAQVVPENPGGMENIIAAIKNLVDNWEALGALGIVSAILSVVVRILNSSFCRGWFGKQSPLIKRLIIVVLGQLIAILSAVSSGVSWTNAIIAGLLTSGGAVAIYESLKPLLKKKE